MYQPILNIKVSTPSDLSKRYTNTINMMGLGIVVGIVGAIFLRKNWLYGGLIGGGGAFLIYKLKESVDAKRLKKLQSQNN